MTRTDQLADDLTHGSAAEGIQRGARANEKTLLTRLGALTLFFALQAPFIAFLFDPLSIHATDPGWRRAHFVLREGVPALLFFGAALALLLSPHRRTLFDDWKDVATDHAWRMPLAVNAGLFTILVVATLRFNAEPLEQPPWSGLILWIAGVVGLYGALFFAAAPLTFWRHLVRARWPELSLAAGAALLIAGAAVMSRQSWGALSEATFHLSAWILSLYESNIASEPAARILGIGDFRVSIAAACSGYEGIGLVLGFMSIYLWVFRKSLRFPNAWALLPIGAVLIWLLNAVRIAALVSLGAHVSPEIAVNGFHSQAGWMTFLAVTIGLMVVSHRIAFFNTAHQSTSNASAMDKDGGDAAAALLAPFLAVTAAGLLIAAFTVEGAQYYGLKVAAGAAALIAFARHYQFAAWRFHGESALLGLFVGALWIATDPGRSAEGATGDLVATLGPVTLGLWLAARLVGTIIIVPLAEEFAFRGYLHRALSARRFVDAPIASFSWPAFLISSALFGVLHERWLAGALAGAAFAVALYRSGRISGAVIAHMAANALIAAWAIAFQEWSLLS